VSINVIILQIISYSTSITPFGYNAKDMKKIFIAADHRGYGLKDHLKHYLSEKGYFVTDCGNTNNDPQDDYPDFAHKVAEEVQKDKDSLGVVICGTGIGVSITANKHRGIRSAVAHSKEEIASAREHNMINVLAISANNTDSKKAEEFMDTFLDSGRSDDERHMRRVQKIDLA